MFEHRAGDSPEGGPPVASATVVRLAFADVVAAFGVPLEAPGAAGPGTGLSALPGGPLLAARLATIDLDGLSDAELREVVAGWERVAARAHAGAAAAAAALADREAMNPGRPEDAARVDPLAVVATDLSLRLGVSRQAAATLVTTGRALGRELLATGAALARGDLDWAKARAVVQGLAGVPWQVAQVVEDEVLPRAPRRTVSQLERDVAEALAEADPQDAEERAGRATERRRVERPRRLPDGMACVRAVVPAEVALRLDATLHAAALAAASRPDERRTVDQLRADVLDAMARDAWDRGWVGPAPGEATDARPGPGWRLAHSARRRAQVQVTVGVGTLLGLDDRPGHLAGYGPVDAATARRIAAEGTWRRLLVDEPTGTVVDVGRTRYEPPPDLAELVTTRDRYCVVPTCSVPAASCDLDHTVPFRPGQPNVGTSGATEAANLAALCRTHHLLKTHGGLRVEQPAPGHFVLRTPTGGVWLSTPPRPPGVPQVCHLPKGTDGAGRPPSVAHPPPRGADPPEPAVPPPGVADPRDGAGGAPGDAGPREGAGGAPDDADSREGAGGAPDDADPTRGAYSPPS